MIYFQTRNLFGSWSFGLVVLFGLDFGIHTKGCYSVKKIGTVGSHFLEKQQDLRCLWQTSNSGSIGSMQACGPRDPRLNPAWGKLG